MWESKSVVVVLRGLGGVWYRTTVGMRGSIYAIAMSGDVGRAPMIV